MLRFLRRPTQDEAPDYLPPRLPDRARALPFGPQATGAPQAPAPVRPEPQVRPTPGQWTQADDEAVQALLAEHGPAPTVRLTEDQVAALVTEGAYRASIQTAIATLARARQALEGQPEAQAVLSALLDEVDGE